MPCTSEYEREVHAPQERDLLGVVRGAAQLAGANIDRRRLASDAKCGAGGIAIPARSRTSRWRWGSSA